MNESHFFIVHQITHYLTFSSPAPLKSFSLKPLIISLLANQWLALILSLLNPQSHQPELDASSILKCIWPLLPLYPLWKFFLLQVCDPLCTSPVLLLLEGSVLGLLPIPCTVSLCELTLRALVVLYSWSPLLCPQLKSHYQTSLTDTAYFVSPFGWHPGTPCGPHPNRTKCQPLLTPRFLFPWFLLMQHHLVRLSSWTSRSHPWLLIYRLPPPRPTIFILLPNLIFKYVIFTLYQQPSSLACLSQQPAASQQISRLWSLPSSPSSTMLSFFPYWPLNMCQEWR